MKKQTNIAALKELVNNNVLESVRLRINGVQAYNIAEGEEYTVIVRYEKQRGRYYFVARDGRRFLASHYDRAEFVAGEMLAVIAEERSAAQHAAEQVKASGSVAVCSALLPLFFKECDRLKINVKSTTVGVDDLGRMLTRYDLVKDEEPAQQEDSNDESDNNNAQSNDSNDSNETPAEPATIAQKVEKVAGNVKAYAAKVHALQSAVVRYILGIVVAVVFSLSLAVLPFLACFVIYAFLTSSSVQPKDVILIFTIETFFLVGGWSIWTLLKNGHIYNSWHDCKVL